MKLAINNSVESTAGAATVFVRGSNQSGMRAFNERLVLSLVREHGELAKAQITHMTGLSAQTVSVIMRALEADGLLKKGAPVRGKVGQPSVPMSLCHDGAYFFGLQVGRRSLEVIMTDFLGRVEQRMRMNYSHPTPDGVVEMANEAVGAILEKLLPEQRARVAGLGVALPFQLWDWAALLGVDPADMSAWRDRNIGAEIATHWDFPVFLCNDASAACGAELVFGTQNKPRDFLYFFVGFFVGGGLVLDNALFTGRSGNAGALGSTPITGADGVRCQLVDVASLATLETAHMARGGDGDMIWSYPEVWDVSEDALNQWLGDAADGIAQAIMSSACVVDLQCALIDGWMPAEVRAALVERTASRLAHHQLAGVETPEIHEGTIGRDARSLGAASLPLSERFLVNRNAFLKG